MFTLEYEVPEIKEYSNEDRAVAEQFVDALLHRVLHDLGPTSLPFWTEKFSTERQGNRAVWYMAQDGFLITKVVRNYAQVSVDPKWLLKHYTVDQLNTAIQNAKLNKCLPLQARDKTSIKAHQVRLASGVTESGLARYGFAEAGHNIFTYDVDMLQKYKPQIVQFSIKAMTKMEEKLNRSLRNSGKYDYTSIIEKAIDLIIESRDEEYILGELMLDSRGRAVYECLKTIFNPIANKMARALVVAPPEPITEDSVNNAYMFIAELVSGFNPDPKKKLVHGKACYMARKYHDLDLNTEKGIDDLFENIWLERIYADIEAYKASPDHMVTTPIEVDFGASNITIMGLLLNNNTYIDASTYMWAVDGLHKNHVKFVMTPRVFGSSASIASLWNKNKVAFTTQQLQIMQQVETRGKFEVAVEFKNILTKHCHPTASMKLCVDREQYTVECTKTKNVTESTKNYVVYDSTTNTFKAITHTNTHKVPDLDAFKVYFSSALIHNEDSQILDNICLGMKWILPIHDAGIVTWSGATTMRQLAVREMHHAYDNGRDIIFNYCKSINLDQAGFIKLARLFVKVDKLNGDVDLDISPWLLK